MLFHPLYSLAFCKAWYVRCVSTIIRYLMQWLLSKPVINFQIMNCPFACLLHLSPWLINGASIVVKLFFNVDFTTFKKINGRETLQYELFRKLTKSRYLHASFDQLDPFSPKARQQDGRSHERTSVFYFYFGILQTIGILRLDIS